MTSRRLPALSAVAMVLSISSSYAGPCSDAIARMQVRVDARLAVNAAAGPAAREGVGATMHRQPTPESIARAEESLGEVSAKLAEAVGRTMTRAREADAANDKSACERALGMVEQALGP